MYKWLEYFRTMWETRCKQLDDLLQKLNTTKDAEQ